ncbi:MAG: hypothetical protein K2O12_03005, partial [Muribaculaceae bacterium]|nr:hypothetical protein [Muribaculaceae bacterium]
MALKILLMGDASNYHASLAIGLRRLGHSVTVASAGSGWMNTRRDINISRPWRNKAGGALLYMRLLSMTGRQLRGYDVVHIAGPLFLDLRPHRNQDIFNRLKRNNGAVMLTSLAADSQYVDMSLADDCPLRYTEWRIAGSDGPYRKARPDVERIWRSTELSDMCRYIYDSVDGAVSALYEYQLVCLRNMPAEKVAYGGIPIDTDTIRFAPLEIPDDAPVNIFLGRHSDRQAEKGTDILEDIARKVVDSDPKAARLTIVEDLPYSRYIATLRQAHLTLDQLYSYTPATNALLPMAMGIPSVSGAEPEYYDFISEHRLHPILNADPIHPHRTIDEIYDLVHNRQKLLEIGSQSRE